ncbi:hypothetical protein I4U23_005582 [Adineta vaga]|nr:hypothetical protein I4U23_005582 [Adineta vaga]
MELFRDPVIANDGRVYERSAITQWINEHGTSPFTRQPLQLNELLPDDHLRQLAARRRNSVVSYNAQHSTVTLPPLRTGSRNLRRIHPEETNNATAMEPDNNPCTKTDICVFGWCGIIVLAIIFVPMAVVFARRDSSQTTENGSPHSIYPATTTFSAVLTTMSPTYKPPYLSQYNAHYYIVIFVGQENSELEDRRCT